jgi:peptide/nickel transport system permease protein
MAVTLKPSLRETDASSDAAATAEEEIESVDAPFAWRFLHSPSAVIGGLIVFLVVGTALLSFFWTPHDPNALDLSHTFAGPSLAHPLGTDLDGRDTLSRLMAGSRLTLYAGVLSVLIAAAIGIPAGLVAASSGRVTSEAIMRTADLVYAFPALVAAIALTAALGPSTTTSMLAIGIAFTPFVARVVRSGALSVLSSEYVLAARAYGRSKRAILARHVVPNIMPLIVVQITLLFSIAILAEAALAYLGLGAPPPAASWGLMLNDAQPYVYSDALLSIWPALVIAITVLGFNLLGDGLRDVLDPKLRTRR